jgi:hypothetical protein
VGAVGRRAFQPRGPHDPTATANPVQQQGVIPPQLEGQRTTCVNLARVRGLRSRVQQFLQLKPSPTATATRHTVPSGQEGDAFGSVGALIARPPNPPSASEQARHRVGVGGQPELGLRSDEG